MKERIKGVCKEILIFIISIFIIISITFFMFELVPGKFYDLDNIKNETIIKNIESKYELDNPIEIRYMRTLKNVFTLDFGYSLTNNRDIRDIIKENFPVSFVIGISVIIFSMIIGILSGTVLAYKEKYSNWLIYLFVIFTSLPSFVIATLLQYLFCVKLHIFPVYGIKSFNSYILPILILSITPIIFITRTIEKQIRNEKNKNYILAAEVRGLNDKIIYFKYILKNCISVILTYIGPLTANLVVGSFVIESIFNIPGLGRYFITSITNRDFPVVFGLTIFYSILLIGITTIINILTNFIDYKGDVYGNKN